MHAIALITLRKPKYHRDMRPSRSPIVLAAVQSRADFGGLGRTLTGRRHWPTAGHTATRKILRDDHHTYERLSCICWTLSLTSIDNFGWLVLKRQRFYQISVDRTGHWINLCDLFHAPASNSSRSIGSIASALPRTRIRKVMATGAGTSCRLNATSFRSIRVDISVGLQCRHRIDMQAMASDWDQLGLKQPLLFGQRETGWCRLSTGK
jgi:hypothetical protein